MAGFLLLVVLELVETSVAGINLSLIHTPSDEDPTC